MTLLRRNWIVSLFFSLFELVALLCGKQVWVHFVSLAVRRPARRLFFFDLRLDHWGTYLILELVFDLSHLVIDLVNFCIECVLSCLEFVHLFLMLAMRYSRSFSCHPRRWDHTLHLVVNRSKLMTWVVLTGCIFLIQDLDLCIHLLLW